MSELYTFTVRSIDGQETSLELLRGKVGLIVNVASRCGFTPQYRELEELYQKYREQGLVVLGFPCNQFGGQEPGGEAEIASFCSLTYQVTFPLFAKIEVNGAGTHPLYAFLKKQAPGLLRSTAIKWNFTKFLFDRSGGAIVRYAPTTAPRAMESALARLLQS